MSVRACAISGARNGNPITRKPYRPAFDCTAETDATTGGGSSAYVSGIQVWNGNTGVLIRNANAKPAKIHRPQAVPIPGCAAGLPITSVVPATTPNAAVASSSARPPHRL